jgi:hypothetical protein
MINIHVANISLPNIRSVAIKKIWFFLKCCICSRFAGSAARSADLPVRNSKQQSPREAHSEAIGQFYETSDVTAAYEQNTLTVRSITFNIIIP